MLAFGSYNYHVGGGDGGDGSSLSPSNLSALAPPFMAATSFPKPNLNNFTEVPYTPLFDPSTSVWHPHHSLEHTSGPNYLVSESVSTICQPSSDIYRSPYPQMNDSTNAHYAPLNPVTAGGCVTTFDIFPNDKYSDSSTLPTSVLAEPGSYCSPHVSSLGYDDSPPLVYQEPSYNLPSKSYDAQLGGYSQAGFAQNLSGINYPSTWGQYYTGSVDGEPREWLDHNANLNSKDYDLCDTASSRTYMRPEEHATEGFGSHRDASAVSGNCYDSFGRRYQHHFPLHDTEDGKVLLQHDARANNPVCSDEPAMSSTSIRTPDLHEALLQSTMNICNSHTPSNLSIGNSVSFNGSSSVIGDTSATKAHPSAVIKPPSGVYAHFVEYDLFDPKEHHRPFGLNCQSNSSMVSAWDFSSGSAFNNGTCKSEGNPGVNNIFSDSSTSEAMALRPHVNCSDGVKLRSDGVEAISIHKHSDSPDLYSHTVDSPCWKGAPGTNLSLSDAFETVASLPSVRYNAVMNQESEGILQYTTTKPKDEDGPRLVSAIHLPYEGVTENTFLPQPSVIGCVSRECNDSDYTQVFSDSKQNPENELPSIDNSPITDFSCGGNPKTEVNFNFPVTQQTEKTGKFTCLTKPESQAFATNEKNGRPTGATSIEVLSTMTPNSEDHFQTESALEGNTSSCQPSEIGSNSEAVSYVVRIMKDLSELLHYLNPTTICQQDQVTLKHIINNLSAIVGKEAAAAKNPLTEERWVFPLHKEHVQNRAAGVDSEQKRHVFRRENKDSQGSLSLNHSMDGALESESIQAIKSVLRDNIHSKEEKDPQAMMYKNLWLEAEAALCAITTKARLSHMKLEMEKYASHKEEETADAEIVSMTKVSSDACGVPDPVVTANISPTPVILTPDPHSSINSTGVVDSSIMMRYHAPSSLMSRINFLEKGGQQSPKKENIVPSCDSKSLEICINGIGSETEASSNGSSKSGISCEAEASSNRSSKSVISCETEAFINTLYRQKLQSLRRDYCRSPLDCQNPDDCSSGVNESNLITGASDNIEASDNLSEYRILESFQDNSDELLRDTAASEQSVQDFYFNSAPADTDNLEASVLSRFWILRSRIEGSKSGKVDTPELPVQATEPRLLLGSDMKDGSCWQDLTQQKSSFVTEENVLPENKTDTDSDRAAGETLIANWPNAEGWDSSSGSGETLITNWPSVEGWDSSSETLITNWPNVEGWDSSSGSGETLIANWLNVEGWDSSSGSDWEHV